MYGNECVHFCASLFSAVIHTLGRRTLPKLRTAGTFFLLNLTGFFTETDLWPVPWINSWNPFGVHPEITPTKPVSVNYDDVILGEMQPCVHATFRAPEPDGLLGILTRKPVSCIRAVLLNWLLHIHWTDLWPVSVSLSYAQGKKVNGCVSQKC